MKYVPITFGIVCLFFSHFLIGQPLVDDTETYGVLVFEKIEQQKMYFIRVGGWIKYRLYGKPVTHQGTLEKVTKTAMYVDGKEISLADCSMIAGRVRSDKDVSGAILLGVGLASAPFGAAILSFAGGIGGPIVIAAGIVVLGVGLYMMMKKRFFRLDKNWVVYGGNLSFNRSHN